MDPRTAISYSLLLCFVVNIGICLSSVEERNHRSSNSILITDVIGPGTNFGDSESKFLKRYRRVPSETYDDDEDEEDDIDGAPPDHVVPYTAHEDPEEPATKPKYTKPGDWAKPPPERDVPLDFVPTKLYAQVRGTHTVKRVPQEEAIETAETAEDILSAPRLREVVSKSKKNTIYTEEGYEDSAYDHAGHIRDADFHEGFAKKLDDKRKSEQNSKNKSIDDEKEMIKNEESGSDVEFNEYDDDYRDHVEESSRIEETKPLKQRKKKTKEEKYKSNKDSWLDPDTNPKQFTENEIERLEEDLEKEYAESEKNVEDQVPENLKNTGDNYDDEAEESKSEQDFRNDQDYGKRTDKNIAESREASREISKNPDDERIKIRNNEYSTASSTKVADREDETSLSENPVEFRKESANPAGFTVYDNSQNSQNIPGEFSSTTPNYGKIFWNYFKLVGDKWKPNKVSTPSDITTVKTEADSALDDEEFTSVPTFASVQPTLRDFDTFSFTPPSTELNDYVFASSGNMNPVYSRAASLYESWKRQGRETNSQESPAFGNLETESKSYPMEFGSTTNTFVKDSAMNINHDDTTTLVAPKKLSYTVIIRSNDKTTTTSPEVHKQPEETNSIVQLTSPKYTKMLKYLKDKASPQEINDIIVQHQDFTVIQPPLSVPLRHVTYSDFVPDTYAIPVHQSVTQESGQLDKKVKVERERYNRLQNPYDKRFSNLFNHVTEAPHFHHHRGHHSPSGCKRNHLRRYLPSAKLLPPSPMIRSKYAEYLGVKRLRKPRTRFNRSPRLDPWSELLQLYRSIDRNIFERRKRRSLGRERKIYEPRDIRERQFRRTIVSNDHEKVNHEDFDESAKTNLQPKRNFFRLGANRLVALDAAGILNLSRDENVQREKSSKTMRRRRDHEDLLNKSPIIAEEEINAEIESRFKNNGVEDDEEKYDDSTEKERDNIDIQVPDFNVSEVIENKKNEKVISNYPTEANRLDTVKYPFYDNSKVPQSSALKYVTNPRQVPRKTLGGIEFYDSRDRYRECDEVEPNLDSVVPEEEEPLSEREPRGDEPRLRGLGDKLDCFRAKYFDENPLDNPLFFEEQIDQPRIPKDFDTVKFTSRIFGIPSDDQLERELVTRVSRKPEIDDHTKSESKRNQVTRYDEQNPRKINSTNLRRDKEQSTKNRRNRRKRPNKRGQKKKSKQASTEPPQYYPVTPYQREVYEDVMGTIKNLAGMYEAFGEAVETPSTQSIVNVHAEPREKKWNFPVVHKTERPRNFLIHGMLPPQETSEHQPLQRYRIIPYKTNKVSYRTRVRTKGRPDVRVGYFKTVRVHKRSIDDSGLSKEPDMDTEESRNIGVRGIKQSTIGTNQKNKTSRDTKREEKPEASERVVYTIRDRIRYSKPREDFGKNGKFSNLEAAGTEDVRRQEPRYKRIQRKLVNSSTNDPSTVTNKEEVKEVESTTTALKPTIYQDRTKGRQDFHDEPGEIYKIQFSTTRGTQTAPTANRRRDNDDSIDAEEDYEEEKGSGESRKDKLEKKNYDVHENVEEDVTTVANLNVVPTKAPEFVKLGEYLKSEPPGYSEAFTESSTESTLRHKGKRKEEEGEQEEVDDEDEEQQTKSYQRDETRRDNEKKQEGNEDEEQEEDEQVERPSESYGNEESSPRSEEAEDEPESSVESESYKNAENDEDEAKVDEGSHDGEKEFHRFASRPYSPFESYEDPKYSDLGPRISKPAFHHPSFSKPTSSKNRRGKYSGESYYDGSDEEETEKTSRYIFPWEQDEAEGVDESKNSRSLIGKYEYPWEKRERLAKERRKKEKARREYEKLFGFSDSSEDDDEEEEQSASNTELLGRRVYPWEHYDVPSKIHQRGKNLQNSQIIDNVEVGTEYRPVTKFSSRYKSRTFNLNDDGNPIVVSVVDPSEMKDSVIEHTKKTSETPPIDPIKVLKNIIQVNSSSLTNSHRVAGGTNSTNTPKMPRNRKTNFMSINSTVAPITTTHSTPTSARPRFWRTTLITTKKPMRSRKRVISPVSHESINSGSQRTEVTTINSVKRNYSNFSTVTPLETTTASVVNRKNRRRRKFIERLYNSTATTVRSVRRRLPKTTVTPKRVEETTVKSVTERNTTPKSKTIEHRSSFSKEEIITKTSYPRLDTDEDKEQENEDSIKNERRGKGESKKLNNLMNESVKKVSIVTKKTPDHIYRTEEVDKDGVKGMFVSITPNNGTSSSLDSMEDDSIDRTIDNEETKEMLKRFEDFDDKENEQDTGSSYLQDSYLMANLLRQVPPFINDLTFDDSFQGGGMHFLETEGSGEGESDEDVPDHARFESRSNYEKDPNNRLYYYVEK